MMHNAVNREDDVYPEHSNPARRLAHASKVTAVSPENAAAVTLALHHARLRLSLPPFDIVWVSHPGGTLGETWFFEDGGIEVLLNAGVDASPRTVAWTLLHELKHVADGRHRRGMSHQEAEDAANAFASDVTERQTEDFYRLDWRRPSGRR